VIDCAERIKLNNVRLHLDTLLERYLNTTLRLSFADELDVILFDKLLLTTVLFKLRNLLLFRLVVGDLLLEVLHLIIAILKEDLFLFVFLPKLL